MPDKRTYSLNALSAALDDYFIPADKAGLTEAEKVAISDLLAYFEAIFLGIS